MLACWHTYLWMLLICDCKKCINRNLVAFKASFECPKIIKFLVVVTCILFSILFSPFCTQVVSSCCWHRQDGNENSSGNEQNATTRGGNLYATEPTGFTGDSVSRFKCELYLLCIGIMINMFIKTSSKYRGKSHIASDYKHFCFYRLLYWQTKPFYSIEKVIDCN